MVVLSNFNLYHERQTSKKCENRINRIEKLGYESQRSTVTS